MVANRVVDNTAPTAVDVQTTNAAGGTAGKPEAGDVLTYMFSEPMKPASILAGWTGAATAVVVRFTNGNPDVITVFDATNATQLALGESLENVADQFGIAKETARSQLKSIFTKTGVHRQAELVAVLAKLL